MGNLFQLSSIFLFILLVIGRAVALRECLIVVPGLSSEARIAVVEANMKIILSQVANRLVKTKGGLKHISDDSDRWDCVVYTSVSRQDTQFWSALNSTAPIINRFCTVIDNPGKYFADHLYMVNPLFVQQLYRQVLLVSENTLLASPNDPSASSSNPFDLSKFLELFSVNQLTVASPLVRNSNKVRAQRFRDIMQTPSAPGIVGHETAFLAMHVWLMTVPAYRALWELVFPSLNPHGWGYDMWFDAYARERLPQHKMGIVTVVSADALDSVEPGTETPQEKWTQQMKQENYFESFFEIPLKRYRKATRNSPVLSDLKPK